VKNPRLLALSAVLIGLAGASAAPSLAQDPAPAPAPAPAQDDRRIGPGITAGGVDVGNLTVTEAAAKLEQSIGAQVRRPVTLVVAGKTFRLDAATAKLTFDTLRTAKRAFYAQAPDASTGGGTAVGTDVPLAVTFSTLSIRAWAREAAGKVYRAPRDATMRIGLKRIDVRASKKGRKLDTTGTERIVKAALADYRIPRELTQKLSVARPAVTYATLQRQYPTIITVSKSEFKLRLFKRLRFSKSYGVAVGQPAYPTPSGRFQIQNKQIDPVWSVPNSPWAGELGGTTVSGGSYANPLKARWMGIANGVGIHGTGQEYSIGSRASHGCIRMRVADVKDLYPRVPVGAPIVIR
jgi:lipoprotein-anchoring transpeptidase ErfK/SrfK